jgi:hypothetical protein
MKRLWHLTVSPTDVASQVKSFCSVKTIERIQGATEGDSSLTALTQATPGNWRIETPGADTEKAPVLIVWAAPWAFECVSRCKSSQLDGYFQLSAPCISSIPMAMKDDESNRANRFVFDVLQVYDPEGSKSCG